MKQQLSSSLFKAGERAGEYVVQRPVTESELLDFATKLLEQRFVRADFITEPNAATNYLTLRLATLESEVFSAIFLDNRHRVISFDILFNGTISGAAVYAREVVKAALKHNAAAVVLSHNHPSGVAEPSQSDIQLTERLSEALALIDVRVLDHIIIGGTQAVSFAERGLL